MGEQYRGYKRSLNKLDMITLEERRKELCLQFAIKCTKNPKTRDMFPKNIKTHTMTFRNTEKYEVQHANTARLKKSAIIYMQQLLNEHEKT